MTKPEAAERSADATSGGERGDGSWRGLQIFALGHSTGSRDELFDRLAAHGVSSLADIRSFPRSRRNPQFNLEELQATAVDRGIGYVHLAGLGGRRRPRTGDETNAGWRHPSFRGYADYMQTDDFLQALEELRRQAARGPVAILCSEAVPWRCHRSLVADALLVRGASVVQLIGERAQPHRLTPFAVVEGTRITYPPG